MLWVASGTEQRAAAPVTQLAGSAPVAMGTDSLLTPQDRWHCPNLSECLNICEGGNDKKDS